MRLQTSDIHLPDGQSRERREGGRSVCWSLEAGVWSPRRKPGGETVRQKLIGAGEWHVRNGWLEGLNVHSKASRGKSEGFWGPKERKGLDTNAD